MYRALFIVFMDLSPELVRALTSLRMARVGGVPRPHKPALLLAVVQLAETGRLPANAVPFDPATQEAFAECWRAATDEPVGRIEYPFWYLASEPIWELVSPGGGALIRPPRAAPSARRIAEQGAFARLTPELFEALRDPVRRAQVRGLLVATYFPERQAALAEVQRFEQAVYRYTQRLQAAEPAVRYRSVTVPERVRAVTFRRLVTGAYGYTCAVSGARLTLPVGAGYQLVEAAHIQDWSVTHDDAPQNGLALTPTYHWLFERGLFTLSDDGRVRVSPAARSCVGTVEDLLLRFDGAAAHLPPDPHLHPAPAYLAWHRAHKYLPA